MRVRWRSDLRRWVEDAAGVDVETARRHGGGLMPRPVPAPVPIAPAFTRAAARELVRGFEARLAAAAAAAKAKAARQAERAEAARLHRRSYFARWYSRNWAAVAERRRLKRAAAIT